MPDSCTCGTELAPDSLFCHKCGKPQREIEEYRPEVTEVEPSPVAPPTARIEPPPVNFHNRLAIQIGLTMAILATLAMYLVYVNWLAAGFFTVLIYRRRTGQPLNLQTGMRLGWITGILMFVIMLVILTASYVFISSGGVAGLPAEVRNSPKVQEGLKALQNGWQVAEGMIAVFVFSTMLSMAGGALGAKLSSLRR